MADGSGLTAVPQDALIFLLMHAIDLLSSSSDAFASGF